MYRLDGMEWGGVGGKGTLLPMEVVRIVTVHEVCRCGYHQLPQMCVCVCVCVFGGGGGLL